MTLVHDCTDVAAIADTYKNDGVVAVDFMSPEAAKPHRAALEHAEAQLGPLHYIDKAHLVMTSPYELVTHPSVLDVVEALIGPDILLYNSTYIIKEPGAETFVAWHQDLTYWGLEDDDAQVSMWFALAPATVESGCMAMLPGSHKQGRLEHVNDDSDSNLLLLGQRIEGLDTEGAAPYALEPGQASFHHGWTVHTSAPNVSDDRRIGLNVQYIAPHNRQLETPPTAMLVRGVDRYGYFGAEQAPVSNLDPDAVATWRAKDAEMKAAFKTT